MLRRLAACIAGTLAVSTSFIPDQGYTFEDFNQDFGRKYERGSALYAQRKATFESRLQEILSHNADQTKSYKRGINRFADLTRQEFKDSLGFDRRLARAPKVASPLAQAPKSGNSSRPSRLDWREKGVVSDVKDQGGCGSCWAFASTATIESHVALATGTMLTLSTQQLVSCAVNPLQCGGVGGCQGSIPEVAFQYAQLYGMTTEWMMPYTSYFGKSETCAMNSTQTRAVIQISGYQKLPSNDYQAVMDALVNVGPLAVNVQADVWSDYHSGIFDGCKNMSDVAIDHVVQLVGFGTDPVGGDYWLVRNSWDATWGEKGYIRLRRTTVPECGQDTEPQQGTGCSGGPATQYVCGQCGVLFDASYPLGATVLKDGHHSEIVV